MPNKREIVALLIGLVFGLILCLSIKTGCDRHRAVHKDCSMVLSSGYCVK